MAQDNPLKCEEPDCWHIKARGFIYCTCCLHGRCATIPEGERVLSTPAEEEQTR